jgi:hypothetical protein
MMQPTARIALQYLSNVLAAAEKRSFRQAASNLGVCLSIGPQSHICKSYRVTSSWIFDVSADLHEDPQEVGAASAERGMQLIGVTSFPD